VDARARRGYSPRMGKKRVAGLAHETAERFVRPFRVTDGAAFRLRDVDPADTRDLEGGKKRAGKLLAQGVARLADLQERLWATDRWGVLVLLQAMDAAGKDSTIEHVMSGENPQGVEVHSFKAPSPEELDHDFLRRASLRLPSRGRIGIFNRSYYEEVLVVRVHQELLARQKLPPEVVSKRIWTERYADIAAFERYVARQGFVVLKFFLHVSKEEQRRRFLERIEDPRKQWKFSAADVGEREHWREYLRAYEDAIRATAAPHAPWYVVPADHKWFTRLVVAAAIVDALYDLGLRPPRIDAAQRAALRDAKRRLAAE
jgi:PPK2 family polyphosphate:nucleotide phosphotransferase